jgi:hypothetical protein
VTPVNILDRVLIRYAFCKAQRLTRKLCPGIALEERRQCSRSDQTGGSAKKERYQEAWTEEPALPDELSRDAEAVSRYRKGVGFYFYGVLQGLRRTS